jgi:hypothetical protein
MEGPVQLVPYIDELLTLHLRQNHSKQQVAQEK